MVKKFFVLLIAISMLITSFAGCGGQTQEPDEPTPAAAETADAPAEQKPEPITLTFFNGFPAGNQPAEEGNMTEKWYEEKTGVKLKIERLVGDLNTKVGVMISSGDYPDLIYGHEAHQKFVDAGAVVPMNDMIEKMGPNIKKLYGDINLNKLKKDDGNIYFISPYRESSPIQRPASGMWISKAVLKEFNWPLPKTLDEYFDLLIKYYQKYPQIDGKKTIGFEMCTDSWRFFTVANPPSYLMGYPNDGGVIVNDQTYEAKDFSTMEESKRYFKKLNDVFKVGLIDKESFVANYDQYIARLSSGRVLGMYDQQWQMQPANDALLKAGMGDNLFVALPIVYDQGIQEQYNYQGSFGVRDGISISSKCKEPERAMQFIDFICTDEAQVVNMWGFKDETYAVDANGKFSRTQEMRDKSSDPEYRAKTGLGQFEYPWPRGVWDEKYADGNTRNPSADPDEVMIGYQDAEKEVLKAYDIKTLTDLFKLSKAKIWGVAWDIPMPDDSPAKIANTKMSDTQRIYLPQLIMAKDGQFDAIWDEYTDKMNNTGREAYVEFINKGIMDRVNKWK